MKGFVFDADAFIALERRAPIMLGILDEALHGRIEVVLPRTVIAQVWRGAHRQANVSRLISAGLGRRSPVIIDELTAERARAIGVIIGQTSHPDIVDVHVALAAAERGHAVLTSNDADIAHVDGDLVLARVSGYLDLDGLTSAPSWPLACGNPAFRLDPDREIPYDLKVWRACKRR